MSVTGVPLKQTPLHALHLELGARMVAFAGYELPLQYALGILREHRHTREAASLFDVSHMGQIRLGGVGAAAALEALAPADFVALPPGGQRYALLTLPSGGIFDDIMVTNAGDTLLAVVNASRKDEDLAHLSRSIGDRCAIALRQDRALLALQGPRAVRVMQRIAPDATRLAFMQGAAMRIGGAECFVTRSGYTGEDGFEISLPAAEAARGARLILSQPEVAPAGLGARDTLRLEAGLCLYGQDIDESTSPAEAGLGWTIPKCRREGPRRGGFPGAEIILGQIAAATPRRRVGLLPEIKAPLRHGEIVYDDGERQVGRITSGGFGPSVGAAIAMAYVEAGSSAPGTRLHALVRGQRRRCEVAALPFVSHRYFRGPAT